MFWFLLISPFVVLGLAALIARKGIVVRFAFVLTAIFAFVDAIALWDLMAGSRSSTAPIGLGIIGLVELILAIALLIASPFVRRSAAARENK